MAVKTDSGCPCASDERLVWTRDSAEQAVNTPNDEERLEQMSHPKNKVMERMTLLERWNGLAWVCTAWLWKGLARCGGGGVQGPQCSPKHNAFDSSGCLCLDVTQPLPFLPQGIQGQAMETPSARAHKQTTAQATIQEALQADVSRNVRHVLEDSSGDGYRRPGEWRLSPKKVTKEANQQDVSW